MSEIDWSKAPEGATHYAPAIGSFRALWAKLESGEFKFYDEVVDNWYWGAQPLRSETFIQRPGAWNGAGLPPVGTVCEFIGGDADWHEDLKEGMHVEVIAHFKGATRMLAAFVFGPPDSRQVEQAVEECFKPVKTQEQIEAEEREAFALNLVTEMGKDPETHSRSMVQARKIYDLGYRKQGEDK